MIEKAKFLCIVFIFLLSGCIGREDYSIKWETYEKGVEKAKKENKSILIYFYAEDCMSCRLFEKYILSNRSVIEKSKEFVCIKIDIGKNAELREIYNIEDFPTVLFIKFDKEIGRIQGYNGDVKFFLAEMEKATEADTV